MNKDTILSFLGVFVLGILFQMVFKLPTHYWYEDPTRLHEQDSVSYNGPGSEFLYDCKKITLKSMQATSEANLAWIFLQECPQVTVQGGPTYFVLTVDQRFLERKTK